MMTPGASADLTHTVSAADTALAVGSGDLPVLATPRLLAWAEGATCAAVAGLVGEGQSTVGVRVELQHLVASAVGRVVRVEARLAEVDGRRLRFEVTATQPGRRPTAVRSSAGGSSSGCSSTPTASSPDSPDPPAARADG